MHDTGHWRVRIIPDRVGGFAGRDGQLLGTWDELARDRIVRIARIDQVDQMRRDRDGISRGDLFQNNLVGRRRKTVRDEVGGRPQRAGALDLAHASPAGGVHTT